MEGENLVLLNIIMGILIFGVLLPLVVAFYLLPSIVARLRHHPSKGAIFVTNLFLGWTILGWIILLFYAFSSGTSAHPSQVTNVNVNQNVGPYDRR